MQNELTVERRKRIDAICPRCNGTDIYLIVEFDIAKQAGFRGSRYVACLTRQFNGMKCWYHLKKNEIPAKTDLTFDHSCAYPGCNSSDVKKGRVFCQTHMRLFHFKERGRNKKHKFRPSKKVSDKLRFSDNNHTS